MGRMYVGRRESWDIPMMLSVISGLELAMKIYIQKEWDVGSSYDHIGHEWKIRLS